MNVVLVPIIVMVEVLAQFYVHEAGHWLAARLVGHVAVIEFRIGIPVRFKTYIADPGRFNRAKDIFVTASGPVLQIIACTLLSIGSTAVGIHISAIVYVPFVTRTLVPSKRIATDGYHLLQNIALVPVRFVAATVLWVTYIGSLVFALIAALQGLPRVVLFRGAYADVFIVAAIFLANISVFAIIFSEVRRCVSVLIRNRGVTTSN